ncbi:hypothetical protein ACSU1N_03535 [Thermogladius sp. 4427co]|uniref:hypothetical protein n=1 Tax=Thermogladius sp. 4427co TaxID=3450718 RepID=UPI003F7A0802
MLKTRIALAVALILVVATLLIVLPSAYKPSCNAKISLPDVLYESTAALVRGFGIKVFVSPSAASYLNTSSLESLGLTVSVSDLGALPRLTQPGVIIVNVTDLAQDPLRGLNVLIEATSSTPKLLVFVLNPYSDEGLAEVASDVMLKYYGYRGLMPLIPLESPESNDKLRALTVKQEIFRAKSTSLHLQPYRAYCRRRPQELRADTPARD